MKRIAILGSTGSIGRQTLEVAAEHREKIEVVALAAGKNVVLLAEQVHKFRPQLVAVAGKEERDRLMALISGPQPEIVWGREGLVAAACHPQAEMVVTAVCGAVGIEPTLAAIAAGKDIALANKETLVAAGRIVMAAAAKAGVKILPVDSEHSAIFQCLKGYRREEVDKIILTASGGPFRTWSREEMAKVTPEMALRHPNWDMGAKITVDSATMMNKGLEVIEARWLYDLPLEKIEVTVHPESIVHSFVVFRDGSWLGQLALPDMRLPIQYALSYPERWENSFPRLNLWEKRALHFEPADEERFPCLRLAYAAGRRGGTMPAVLNAANEVAVARFLRREIGFLDIPRVVEEVMAAHVPGKGEELEEILAADRWAREVACKL
ncbi:MAG: 1-deoxy-D-xylulose-5-phosphate reductoisomerase [Eubacteriales bacterium]|nr:1-deoxy-D-xylulose-5-phosphate reductoisomerase [Eubacteriales bacterium]MDN5363110.1 1-deoxy-D-xylulose-5-phosphate reductoisomerase [Eubacteriales bacterium]